MQERPPPVVLFQIFRHMFGDEDVAGISTIHHPLCHVDSCSSDVLALVDVGHFIDRATVNSHAERDPRMLFQGPGDFQGALRGRFRAVAKDQRHPIARRQTNQLLLRFGLAELARAADHSVELAQ